MKEMISNKRKVKSPKTFTEQIEILERKNLIVADKERAREVLSRVNYYRLSAYTLTLKTNDRFHDGATFEDLYKLYEFDSHFRYLILELLGIVETTFRTQLSYFHAHKYGSLGWMDCNNFKNPRHHRKIIKELNEQINRSNEVFVEHHKIHYDGQLPIWVAIELTSFGQLSRMFANMKSEDKNELAKRWYKLPAMYIVSWLHALSTFRNICAHYGRTYNRILPIKPRLYRNDRAKGISNTRTFCILFIMSKLIQDQREWIRFYNNLNKLVHAYDTVDLAPMGFPADWKSLLGGDIIMHLTLEASASKDN